MPKKAIAAHSIFLVGVIAMLLFFTVVIFWEWISSNQTEATKAACIVKLKNFCLKWTSSGNKPDWDSINPQNCEDLDPPILEPSQDYCNNLI